MKVTWLYFNVIILYWPHMVILIYICVAEFQAGNTCRLDIPAEVDNYHCLYPLEQRPSNPMHKSSLFDYRTSVYRATNSKDGLAYCLKRVHGTVCHSPVLSVCWLSRILETLDAALYKFRINSLLCVVLLHVLHGKLFVGFRLTNTKCMQFIEQWKKIQHANVVQLREVFTTKAFADNCKALHIVEDLPSACFSMTPACS